MARKKAGFYSDEQISGSSHQLIVELDEQEMMCMTKSLESGLVVAFELFSLDKDETEDWNDIFYEIKTASKLFNNSYKQVTCYFNTAEAILVPEKLLTATSAEDYLNLMFGENSRMEVKYEKLVSTKVFINAYRIRKSLSELLSRQFIIFQTAHVYTSLLNDVLSRPRIEDQFIKLQFYTHHFIVGVWKGERLQLVQTYAYITAEDALYYLLRLTQQFGLDTAFTFVELSGMLDLNTDLHKQLQSLFPNLKIDTITASGIFVEILKEYPSHYFTPFYKLSQ